jgi:hypothetical protein
MFKNKIVIFIFLATVLVSGKVYCQEKINNPQMKTIVGKVIRMDEESNVISVETGAVTKQAFSDAHLNADSLWGELIKNGYIDPNGTIRTPFYRLDKFSDMILPKKFNTRKKLIYGIFQKAMIDNGIMTFEISLDSELLQDTHVIVSVEIEEGDPVTVHYISTSPDKNTIIRFVDNKVDDDL